MTVRLGIVLPQHECGPTELTEAAVAAEGEGLDSLWILDHLHGRPRPDRPILEGWTSLSFIAAKTSSIDIGTLVLRVGIRAPAVVAAMVSTANEIAPRRFWLGLGIGDSTVTAEQDAYGIPQRGRSQRLSELQTVLEEARRGSDVRILIGGGTPEVLRISERADGWNFWGSSEALIQRLQQLRRVAPAFSGEISWATQSFPAEKDVETVHSEATEVIVATGAANYRERIGRLSRLRELFT